MRLRRGRGMMGTGGILYWSRVVVLAIVYLFCLGYRGDVSHRCRRGERIYGERISIYFYSMPSSCWNLKPLDCSFQLAWLAFDRRDFRDLLWHYDLFEPD